MTTAEKEDCEDRAAQPAAKSKQLPLETEVALPQDAEGTTKLESAPDAPLSHGSGGISRRRLIIIVIGLCLSIFLIALDQVLLNSDVHEPNDRLLCQRQLRQ
jgi:hypothetical protein